MPLFLWVGFCRHLFCFCFCPWVASCEVNLPSAPVLGTAVSEARLICHYSPTIQLQLIVVKVTIVHKVFTNRYISFTSFMALDRCQNENMRVYCWIATWYFTTGCKKGFISPLCDSFTFSSCIEGILILAFTLMYSYRLYQWMKCCMTYMVNVFI